MLKFFEGVGQMTSDNSKSQIDFLDLKMIEIKIQALLLLRFNLRFQTLLFDSPANKQKSKYNYTESKLELLH